MLLLLVSYAQRNTSYWHTESFSNNLRSVLSSIFYSADGVGDVLFMYICVYYIPGSHHLSCFFLATFVWNVLHSIWSASVWCTISMTIVNKNGARVFMSMSTHYNGYKLQPTTHSKLASNTVWLIKSPPPASHSFHKFVVSHFLCLYFYLSPTRIAHMIYYYYWRYQIAIKWLPSIGIYSTLNCFSLCACNMFLKLFPPAHVGITIHAYVCRNWSN